MKTEIAFLILVLLHVSAAADGTFFFSDQQDWGTFYKECGGEEQSPIDIITEDVVHDSKLDQPFDFSDNFLEPLENVSCKNDGQSYKCDVMDGTSPRTMEGGNLIQTPMTLLQFHVHFGSSTSYIGSEHRVNGKQYPAEIHFVFIRNGFTEIENYGDLAVWGFFIEVLKNGYEKKGSLNDVLNAIEGNLRNYEEDGSGVDLNGVINLSEIIPVNNYHAMGSFYRYKGGLTTPTCNEVVQWTVFKDPLYISEGQYLKMTKGKTWPRPDGNPVDMVNTFRVPQPLNERPVTRSLFAGDGGSSTSVDDPKDDYLSTKVFLQSSASCLLTAALGKFLLH